MSRKGENIYKRKDNRWEGRYIKCYDNEGRKKYGYIYGASYAEAKERLQKVKGELSLGIVRESGTNKRLGAFALEWLKINRFSIMYLKLLLTLIME